MKTLGSQFAPITFEVFSDYQCPSCRNLYEQTLRPMMNDYVAAGKVYIVHRDFPLPMHKYSYEAARWANAAARIGKFEEVEAAIYDNQNAWSADGNLEKYVSGALGAADFRRVQKLMDGCQADNPPAMKATTFGGVQANHGCPFDTFIEQDKALGNRVPVQATPTFVIYCKGQKYPAASGFITWPVLKQFLDSLLTQ
ncbi:MAG: thioredoxin domain-containing protein [Candidatus Acidiferrales bacterium]